MNGNDHFSALSQVLDALEWGYWQRDLATGEMVWSETFRRQHGIALDEPALREVFLTHLHPDDRDRFVAQVEAAYQAGRGVVYYRALLPDGTVRPFVVRIVVIENEAGRRVAYGINRYDERHRQLDAALAERTRTLNAVIAALPVGLLVFDAELHLRYWNDLAFAILDLPRELARDGATFAELIRIPAERGEYGPGDPEQYVAERVALAKQFLPHRLERRHPNGRWHLVQGVPFFDDEGRPAGFVSTFTDITSIKETEAALQVTLDRLRTLVDHLPSGVSLFDADLNLRVWNRRFAELLDFPVEMLERGVDFPALLRFNLERGEYGAVTDPEAFLRERVEMARRFIPHQMERTRPNGRTLQIVGQPIPSGGFVTIYSDVTEERRAEAELRRLALHDELTGLTNRAALIAQLPRLCEEAKRRGEPLALLFVDLDRFKWVNDTAGHEVGDAVLRAAAERLRDAVRGSDLIARVGGDEFVVVTSVRMATQAGDLAQRLIERFVVPFEVHESSWQLTPSIGIALFPDDAQEPQALLRAADLAMYRAKAEGGNRFAFFTRAMQEEAEQRSHLEQRLRQAIHHERLSVVFQPICTAEGQVVSAEVLLRWHDEVLGNVSPARFIPLAEEVGLMPSIGRWVLSTALRHFAQWQRVQLAPATIAVNLSAHQLYDPDLTATVLAALSESGVAPHCLTLEITESAMMRDPNLAKQQVEELAKLGITFAIDDFGTGYSSLAYLHTFPLTKLKIDRTFVAPLATDDTDDAIVDATIQMAHRLGLQVVAEGVECEAQRDHLRRLGCNLYQGYWFARPMGAIEFATFCQQHR
ncbi:EAL domain-containing protein [Hydrogenophilus islandicus]